MLILNVIDASCYWVRILEHKPTDRNQTSSQIADSTEFLELTMAVSGWYADPNHRVKQELIVVGDLCCVKLENSNSFHRYSTRNMQVLPMQSYLLVCALDCRSTDLSSNHGLSCNVVFLGKILLTLVVLFPPKEHNKMLG